MYLLVYQFALDSRCKFSLIALSSQVDLIFSVLCVLCTLGSSYDHFVSATSYAQYEDKILDMYD